MRRSLVTIKNVHIGLIGQNGLNVPNHVEEDSGTHNVISRPQVR